MQPNKQKDHISKILHVAIIFFATTIGIGLYALIGAPIKNSSTFKALGKITNNLGAVGGTVIDSVFNSRKVESSDKNINVKISNKDSAFQALKTTLIDSNILKQETSLIKFSLDGKEIGIPQFLYFKSDIKPGDSLLRMMGESRYYISNNDEYEGAVVISIIDSEIAFASLMGWEGKFIETTLPLIHPMLSKSDISMYMNLGTVSRNIASIDSRVIYGANEEIIYVWGLYNNSLIIAGSMDGYSKIIDALK